MGIISKCIKGRRDVDAVNADRVGIERSCRVGRLPNNHISVRGREYARLGRRLVDRGCDRNSTVFLYRPGRIRVINLRSGIVRANRRSDRDSVDDHIAKIQDTSTIAIGSGSCG